MTNSNYIDSDQKLNHAIGELRDADILAIDTEFVRRTTYFPQIALIQIASRERIYLIDPVPIASLAPLKELMTSSVVKIAHSAGEDLEVLRLAVGAVPEPLFDTQIAAAFLGYGAAPGYANLLNMLYGLDLDKSETTSNWLARPLSESQISYAEQDVIWLPKIYDRFVEELNSLDRLLWCERECQAQVDKNRRDSLVEDAARRFRVRDRWDAVQLGRLQNLAVWREKIARSEDKPRNWILKDAIILQLAERRIESKSDLSRLHDIHPRILRKYSTEIIAVNNRTVDAAHSQPLPRLTDEQRRSVKAIQKSVNSISETLNLPAPLLAKKSDIEAFVRDVDMGNVDVSPLMLGWRRQVIGEKMLQLVKEV